MTDVMMGIAMQYMPNSIRVGLDVEILDVDALEIDYYGYKWAEGGEHYHNVVYCVQLKHKWIEKPFWINVFKGAQSKTSDAHLVIATWDKKVDVQWSSIGENDTLYKADAINQDVMGDGSESLSEIIQAFDDLFFEDDESLVNEDAYILSFIAEKIYNARFFKIDFVMSTENPTIDNIKFIEDKAYEAEGIYRKYYGKVLCETMRQRGDMPPVLKKIFDDNNIKTVMFESVVDSGEWGIIMSLGEYESSEHMFTIACSESFSDETDAICNETSFINKYDEKMDDAVASEALTYISDIHAEYSKYIIAGKDYQ